MAITTRASKGSALTHTEMDANLTNLNNDKLEKSDERGFKNYIINGGFDVWQRGESFSYTLNNTVNRVVDKWFVSPSGASLIVSKVANTGVMATYDIKSKNRLRVTSTTANDNIAVAQRIEDVRTLQGKTVSISFWVYNAKAETQNAVVKLAQVNSGYSVVYKSASVSMPQGWTKVEKQITLDSIPNGTVIDQDSRLEFIYLITDNTTVDFAICDVQLEEGSVATPFEQRPYGLELSLCQRYTFKLNSERINSYFAGLGAIGDGTNTCSVSVPLPVSPRLNGENVGQVTKVGNMAVDAYSSGGNNITGISSTRTNNSNLQIIFNTSTSLVTGNFYRFTGNLDAYLLFDWEL